MSTISSQGSSISGGREAYHVYFYGIACFEVNDTYYAIVSVSADCTRADGYTYYSRCICDLLSNTIISAANWYTSLHVSSIAAAKLYASNKLGYTLTDNEIEDVDVDKFPKWCFDHLTEFHSDPVYVEATKLRYTDGTYNFIRGAATAERARKAAYGSLLRTYGSFYRATEQQLSDSFINKLSPANGGGEGN